MWTEDEADPYQTLPYPGQGWHPVGALPRYPHEFVRQGTAKPLTLFHPASGLVRAKVVTSTANAVPNPWLRQELAAILDALSPPAPQRPEAIWAA